MDGGATGPLRRARAAGERCLAAPRPGSHARAPAGREAAWVGCRDSRGPRSGHRPAARRCGRLVGVGVRIGGPRGCLARLWRRAGARRRRTPEGHDGGRARTGRAAVSHAAGGPLRSGCGDPSSGPSYLDDVLLSFDRLRARWRQVGRGRRTFSPADPTRSPDWSAPSYPSDSVTDGVHRCNTANHPSR